jgi:hypothetical protein
MKSLVVVPMKVFSPLNSWDCNDTDDLVCVGRCIGRNRRANRAPWPLRIGLACSEAAEREAKLMADRRHSGADDVMAAIKPDCAPLAGTSLPEVDLVDGVQDPDNTRLPRT